MNVTLLKTYPAHIMLRDKPLTSGLDFVTYLHLLPLKTSLGSWGILLDKGRSSMENCISINFTEGLYISVHSFFR